MFGPFISEFHDRPFSFVCICFCVLDFPEMTLGHGPKKWLSLSVFPWYFVNGFPKFAIIEFQSLNINWICENNSMPLYNSDFKKRKFPSMYHDLNIKIKTRCQTFPGRCLYPRHHVPSLKYYPVPDIVGHRRTEADPYGRISLFEADELRPTMSAQCRKHASGLKFEYEKWP